MKQPKSRKSVRTNPTAVTPAKHVSKEKPALNAMQKHIRAYAGTWDGHCSGTELLRRTRR